MRIIPLEIQLKHAMEVVKSLYKHRRSGIFNDIFNELDTENDKLKQQVKDLQTRLKATEAQLKKSLDNNEQLKVSLETTQVA